MLRFWFYTFILIKDWNIFVIFIFQSFNNLIMWSNLFFCIWLSVMKFGKYKRYFSNSCKFDSASCLQYSDRSVNLRNLVKGSQEFSLYLVRQTGWGSPPSLSVHPKTHRRSPFYWEIGEMVCCYSQDFQFWGNWWNCFHKKVSAYRRNLQYIQE